MLSVFMVFAGGCHSPYPGNRFAALASCSGSSATIFSGIGPDYLALLGASRSTINLNLTATESARSSAAQGKKS